jgi:hypothetical protein
MHVMTMGTQKLGSVEIHHIGTAAPVMTAIYLQHFHAFTSSNFL